MKRANGSSTVLGTLVILGGGAPAWIKMLEQAGWACHRCYDLRAAESLLLEVGPCIGVVDLTRDEFSLQGVAGLVNRNKQVRWLALVHERQLDHDVICQFILNFCIDYFTDPVPESQLLDTIGHQRGMLQLERRVWPQLGVFGQSGLQGEQAAMKSLRHHVKRIAMTELPVLVQGEIGTGKELVARAIHQASTRGREAFVCVNCESLTESWMVDVGAENQPKCSLQAADGGVLFLDEITHLDLARQQDLVRFLRDESLTTETGRRVSADIRLMVSTRYTQDELLASGLLCEELYYRLSAFGITVPTLRERGEDIVLLAEFFMLKFARQYNSPVKKLSPEAGQLLMNYSWPGNVREMIGHIKRAILLSDDKILDVEHLDLPRTMDDKQSLKEIRSDSERGAILAVLENNKGQISAAARELGISRATMYRLLNKHDLVPPPKHLRQDR
ncbi:sigma-54-dependent Fis family transcriptional regulator [Photobacterium gaetbulicola]|uniref:Putative sigma-54 dependent transcriptional regulator n=1 Tax=Photobacterium gaetbulicola Gung47 TaxID=658445 RepID=A0A0C5X3A7_9GAMM|nr:VpsR-related response regulator [Photobacterium gaetbulicola]AJR09860.1 putative sigma-54 dependent transcriptional regulator [Photobacterium gaetbulicola Gung47]PSU12381.1 sigma-54-dependent Fis family transcriptional regulator [Photobacterium gaetbulicola]